MLGSNDQNLMLGSPEEHLGVGMEFVVVVVSFAVRNMIGYLLCHPAFCEVKDLNSKASLYLVVYLCHLLHLRNYHFGFSET